MELPSELPRCMCMWDAFGSFKCAGRARATMELFEQPAAPVPPTPRPAQPAGRRQQQQQQQQPEGFLAAAAGSAAGAALRTAAGGGVLASKEVRERMMWRAPSSDAARRDRDRLKEGFCACDAATQH